jgi:membrane-bound lytic murein transglycosylase A
MTSARLRRGSSGTLARIAGAALILAVAGTTSVLARDPLKLPGSQYEPTTWAKIDGWAEDDHDAAFATFLKSCKAILQGSPSRAGSPMVGALFKVCLKAVAIKPEKPGEARAFFEQNFRPVRISPLGSPDGFVTGYYEPIVEGVRTKGDGYDEPLYRKPGGLLPGGRMVVSGPASADDGAHKSKGRHGPRRRYAAFYDRTAIDNGALAGRNLEICWLKDPIDSFFAQIQGSVRVLLDDGKLMRLNYDAANGQPYYPVGRWLIDRGIVPKDEMSMDRIREWMERHPREGEELRRRNKSYVFFRETRLSRDDEPIGAQGISLTPGRSIAVDRRLHTYGTPFFISAYLPIEGLKPDTWFKRLMIAQDTGGAIVGPARADLYFGAGDEAASVAGRLRHYGKFVMLVPKAVDPTKSDDGEIPLPRPRPRASVIASAPAETPSAKAQEKPAEKREKPASTASDKPAKVAVRTPEPVSKKKAEHAAEKKSKKDAAEKRKDREAEKDKKEKKDKKARRGEKPAKTASRTDQWESRVMPKIESAAASPKKSTSKKKE